MIATYCNTRILFRPRKRPGRKVPRAAIALSESTSKTKTKTEEVSCYCEEVIIDSSEKHEGQDSLFCEGECKIWMHRHCAGISTTIFKEISKSSKPFLCNFCRREKQEKELQSLKATVHQPRQEVTQLRAQTQNLTPATPATPAPNLSHTNVKVKQPPNPSAETPAKQ